MTLDMLWSGHHPPSKMAGGRRGLAFAEGCRVHGIQSILRRPTELLGRRSSVSLVFLMYIWIVADARKSDCVLFRLGGALFGDGFFMPSPLTQPQPGAAVQGNVVFDENC